ncbi:hypothetical protein Tco_1451543, partial [Tanacetum coccineum]
EPLIDGCVVPYDEMFHEDWLQDQVGNGISRRTRRRRSRRKKKQTDNNWLSKYTITPLIQYTYLEDW